MARTPGAIGKPKTINIPLKKLNELFKEETLIEVSIKYANILNLQETEIMPAQKVTIPAAQSNNSESEDSTPKKIQFEIRMPAPKVNNL